MELSEFAKLSIEQREELMRVCRVQQMIQRTHNSLTNEIENLQRQIEHNQNECKHPFAGKTHKSDTGNYSKSDDRYWTEFECPDCGKRWTEEGSK